MCVSLQEVKDTIDKEALYRVMVQCFDMHMVSVLNTHKNTYVLFSFTLLWLHYSSWLINVMYSKTSNISRTLVGSKIVDHSDVVGAAPVGAAPTTSSFSTQHLVSMDWAKATEKRDEKPLNFGIWCACIRGLVVFTYIKKLNVYHSFVTRSRSRAGESTSTGGN